MGDVSKRMGTRLQIAVAALLLWGAAQAGVQARGEAFSPLNLRQQRQLWTFYQAIQRGDRSSIPAMAQTIRRDYEPRMRQPVLLWLARWGASEALPAFDAVIQPSPREIHDAETINFAQAARARLVAQDSVHLLPEGKARAQAEVERFFVELHRTPAQLNEQALIYKDKGPMIDCPMEVYAMQQLADMIYLGSAGDYLDLNLVRQVNFRDDLPSAIKVKVASMMPQARLTWLLDQVAYGGSPSCEMQLLSEMDHQTVFKAASAKRNQMIAARQHKAALAENSLTGLVFINMVIKVCDDPARAAFWAQTDPKYDDRYGLSGAEAKKADQWHDKVTSLMWSDQFADGY